MDSTEFRRDLDAEVSASLANVRLPNFFRSTTDFVGRSLVSVVDACESAAAFVLHRASFVRRTAPESRPLEEHEFVDAGKHHGRWGGGIV